MASPAPKTVGAAAFAGVESSIKLITIAEEESVDVILLVFFLIILLKTLFKLVDNPLSGPWSAGSLHLSIVAATIEPVVLSCFLESAATSFDFLVQRQPIT